MTLQKLILSFLLILVLSGCQQERTANYYLLHPEKLQKEYDQCVYLDDKTAQKESQKCLAVFEAIPIFRSRLDEYINNPNQYALAIMQNQIKIVDLKKAYELAKEADNQKEMNQLKHKINEEEFDLEARFALIRLAFKHE